MCRTCLPFTVPIFALLGMFTSRFVVRSWRWGRRPVREQDVRAIVFGAGHMGRQLVRSLHRDTTEGDRYVPVALLDDDHGKRRLSIDGLRVTGTRDNITDVAERTQASALIIAATTMEGEDLREISELGHLAGLDVLILPPVNELFHAPRGADLRHLNLEDLLGRQRIEKPLGAPQTIGRGVDLGHDQPHAGQGIGQHLHLGPFDIARQNRRLMRRQQGVWLRPTRTPISATVSSGSV